MLRQSIRLFFWIFNYSLFAWLYVPFSSFRRLAFLQYFYLPLSLGFFLLWFYFGYTVRLGFWKGIIIGFISSIPAFFIALVQAYMLYAGIEIAGTWFGIYNPSTAPLIWFYTAFQNWGIHLDAMAHLLTPLLIFLCGVGSYLGSLKMN